MMNAIVAPIPLPYPGAQAPFLSLDDLALAEPLPALVSLCVALSFWGWGRLIARGFPSKGQPIYLARAAGTIVFTAFLAAFVHAVGLLWSVNLTELRILGLLVTLPGLGVALRHLPDDFASARDAIGAMCRGGDGFSRVAVAIVLVNLVLFGLVALAPPTDNDSLHYHLGVPLQWIRAGAIRPMPLWLHSRLVGLGEALILYGLALGADNLSAVLNAMGLLFALIAVAAATRRAEDRVFGILLVASVPILTGLVTSQKPQLYPTAAGMVAVMLIRRMRLRPALGPAFLALGCAMFAVSCKHSFVFSGLLIVWLVVDLPWPKLSYRKLLILVAVCAAALPIPVLMKNYGFYGDPFSPLLERWRGDPDPGTLAFSWYLKHFERRHSLTNVFGLLGELLIPLSLPRLTHFLGLGLLAPLLAWRGRRADRRLLIMAAGLALANLIFGQWNARFFFESYLWAALAVAGDGRRLLARVLGWGLVAQSALVASVLLVGCWSLLPGVFSDRLRDDVLRGVAVDYRLLKELDAKLGQDVVFAGLYRNHVHLPRPFLPSDYFRMTSYAPLNEERKRQITENILRLHGVNTLILYTNDSCNLFQLIPDHRTPALLPPLPLPMLGRNPFGAVKSNIVWIRSYSPSPPPAPAQGFEK